MNIPGRAPILIAALLAAASPTASAFADDAGHGTGGERTGAGLGRSLRENPTLRASMPAPAVLAAPTPGPAARPVAAMPPTQTAPHAATGLADVDARLGKAAAALATHHLRQAATELEAAETRLLNARDLGARVPEAAMSRLIAAREDPSRGRTAVARGATTELRRMLSTG